MLATRQISSSTWSDTNMLFLLPPDRKICQTELSYYGKSLLLDKKVHQKPFMTDIGVRTGKLYLRCGRRRIFPRRGFPGRLKREFAGGPFDDNHGWAAVAIVRQFLRLDPGGGMKDESG